MNEDTDSERHGEDGSVENALRRRIELESIVAETSTKFMHLGPDQTALGMAETVQRLGTFLGADTCSVWLLAENGLTLRNAHRWVAPGVEVAPAVDLPLVHFPWFRGQLPSFRRIRLRSLADLPPEAEAERSLLERSGVRAFVWVPLETEGERLGILGVAARRECSWPDDDVRLLEIVGGVVSSAVGRERAASRQRALYRISEAAVVTTDLAELFSAIHREVGFLMDARNFYVALLDEDGTLSFPYFVDQFDAPPSPGPPRKRLTDWVLRSGEPLLASPEVFEELVTRGEVELVGAPSFDWIGVPLKAGEKTIGVLVVQTYEESRRYGDREKHLLTFVSQHLGLVLEKRRAAEVLRKSEEHYRRLFERNLAGVFRSAPNSLILDCNDAFARILGYEGRSEIVGRTLFNPYVDPLDRERLIEALQKGGPLTNFEFRLKRKQGDVVWILANAGLVPSEEGPGLVLEGTIFDITLRKLAEQQIEFQAYHDTLTGLPNRRLFQDRLAVALAHVRRSGRGLALLTLDLDRFKLVNDSLGHEIGDRLLLEVGRRLVACVRDGDTVARLGGDEFSIILADAATPEKVAPIAEKLLEAVAQPFEVEGHPLFVTTSIGVSLCPRDGFEADSLRKDADTALYRAKDLGRNGFQFATPALSAAAVERASLDSGLRRALARREFLLYFQPQRSLSTGKIVALEALLRWGRDGKGPPLEPAVFIAAAEDSRLIVPIGEWVLHDACMAARAWHDAGHPDVRVGVNLSARQFQHGNLLESIDRALQEAGLSPQDLELEVTESAAMQNLDLTIQALRAARERGIRLAIDDFGTGHSSLTYLKKFPIHVLKIDREFVRDVARVPADRSIVGAVIQTAHSLGLSTVAEGVETKDQLATLRELGCDVVQGYLIGRPAPLDEVPAFFSGALTL